MARLFAETGLKGAPTLIQANDMEATEEPYISRLQISQLLNRVMLPGCVFSQVYFCVNRRPVLAVYHPKFRKAFNVHT